MIFEFDKKVLKYRRFTVAFLYAAVFSAFLIFNNYLPWLATVIICLIITAAFITVWLLQPLYIRKTLLFVSESVIVLKKGVFFSREYIFPNARVVYIETFQLPLQSLFSLKTAVVRGLGMNLLLPPLTLEQCELLKKAVEQNE